MFEYENKNKDDGLLKLKGLKTLYSWFKYDFEGVEELLSQNLTSVNRFTEVLNWLIQYDLEI